MRGGYVEIPDGWERVSTDGPGPFVTSEVLRRPDGTEVHWRSRSHRKGRSVGRPFSPASPEATSVRGGGGDGRGNDAATVMTAANQRGGAHAGEAGG